MRGSASNLDFEIRMLGNNYVVDLVAEVVVAEHNIAGAVEVAVDIQDADKQLVGLNFHSPLIRILSK